MTNEREKIIRADVAETLKRTENFKSFLLDVNDIRGHAHIGTMIHDTKCSFCSQFLSQFENEENFHRRVAEKRLFQSPTDFFLTKFV